jgi:ribosomal protein S27E
VIYKLGAALMRERSDHFVWLECPKCRWRREVPRASVPAGVRCRQCGTVVVMSTPPEIEATLPSPATPPFTEILPKEEFALEPVELPPPSGVQHVTTPGEADIQLAPAPRLAPPPILPSTVPRGSVPIETKRDDMVEPPRNASLYWAFTNNVFEFPFRLYALTQWIFTSFGLAAGAECAIIGAMGLASMSMPGGLLSGTFGMAACILLVMSMSYLASCFLDIIVNTAYNVDKAHDWPNSDYRERLWILLRMAWLAIFVSTVAAGIAGICSLAGNIIWPAFVVVFGLLFPILLLAGLEADSLFWPVSKPIFRSVRNLWRAWAIFYVISALIGSGCGALTYALFRQSPLQMPLIAAPVWAAAVFIYGRLLGRLAWFILHKGDLQQNKKEARRMAERDRWNI